MPVEVTETVNGQKTTHWEAIGGYVLGGTFGAVETVLVQEWLPGAALVKGLVNIALVNGLNYGLREIYRRRKEKTGGNIEKIAKIESEHQTGARFVRNFANGAATGVIVAGIGTAVLESIYPNVFGHAAGVATDQVHNVGERVVHIPEGLGDKILHVTPERGFWDEKVFSSWFGGSEHFPNQENVARHILTKWWETTHSGHSFPTSVTDLKFGSLPSQVQDALHKLYNANSYSAYNAIRPDIYPELAQVGVTFP